jgi:hypothetical protein
VRDRHDGLRRNPWDEFECGHHYARAMASWAVLLALSGYHYDGLSHTMKFSPAIKSSDFRVFWSCGSGWGDFAMNQDHVSLKVLFGKVTLKHFNFSWDRKSKIEAIRLDGKAMKYQSSLDHGQFKIEFAEPVLIDSGVELKIKIAS